MEDATKSILPQTGSPQQQLMPVGELLRRSFLIYRARFFFFIGIIILPVIVGATLGAIFPSLALLLKLNDQARPFPLSALAFLPFLAATVLETAGVVMAELMLILAMNEPGIGFRSLLKKTFGILRGGWWVTLLGTLATFGGIALLLIPGIALGIAFTLALYVFLFEKARGFDALTKSWAYAQGRWGSLFWRMIVLALISWFVSVVINVLLVPLPSMLYAIFGSWLGAILLLPLSAAYTLTLYKNLVEVTDQKPVQSSLRVRRWFVWLALLGVAVTVLVVPLLLSYSAGKSN